MANERLEEIRQERLKKRADLLSAGRDPYPAEAKRSHSLGHIVEHFEALQDTGDALTVAGRVVALRRHGALAFADIRDESGMLQLQLSKDEMPAEIFDRLEYLDVGDFIQAAGQAALTQRGTRSLFVKEFHLITKATLPLPDTWYGLKDQEKRLRQRELDILLNDSVREVIIMRHRLLQWLRSYMTDNGYIEIETPILSSTAGGAAAKPFSTHHNALDLDLHLRIASELHLKRLLVAGFEKVFEMGPRFRNEGIDRQHNPEFTMLESQWAYADYEDLMDFTEDALEKLFLELLGTTDVPWEDETLSFAKPFERKRYVDLVSEHLGFDILEEKKLATYQAIFEKENLELPKATNYYQLVDELYKELVRPTLRQPVLLYDYPAEMAPLAKRSATDPRIAERFQLVAAGFELNSCYTELNDPVQQRELFEEQAKQRAAGDDEAQLIDHDYMNALEQGMPPNAGWSLGVDRILMLLTNTPHLREVITFPLLKPAHDSD